MLSGQSLAAFLPRALKRKIPVLCLSGANFRTREYVPYLICGKGVKPGVDLGTRLCFGTIAHTICDYLGVDASTLDGQSVLSDILA